VSKRQRQGKALMWSDRTDGRRH